MHLSLAVYCGFTEGGGILSGSFLLQLYNYEWIVVSMIEKQEDVVLLIIHFYSTKIQVDQLHLYKVCGCLKNWTSPL